MYLLGIRFLLHYTRSRLWMMRRIAALSREIRSSEGPVGSRSFNAGVSEAIVSRTLQIVGSPYL